MLYEMLSGQRAFGGASFLDTLNSVVRSEPTPLTTAGAEVVKKCLAKSAERRFQTMTELRAARERLTAKPATDQLPSIAVLPFANMSGDPEQEYFSDGFAEDIINALTHVPGLKVIARTSAFSFKGKNEDVRRIAETLGVVNILEGSVRKAGNRIRVTAQLITAADGTHLWSERYDRELNDVFAIQDENLSSHHRSSAPETRSERFSRAASPPEHPCLRGVPQISLLPRQDDSRSHGPPPRTSRTNHRARS